MSRFVRLRGLPWSATEQDILEFLVDVNVVGGPKGIHLVTSRWDGKKTGEAFVELESEKDLEAAFKQNKQNFGHRYIEVFSASNEEAEYAIKKPGAGPSQVVKLRGLPYAVTNDIVEEFFKGLEVKPDREGILIVTDRRGRATGEAYVQFETQDDTEQALRRNREKIGHRYIEIFRSSITEMRRWSGNRPGPYYKKDRGGPRGSGRDFSSNDFGNGRFGGGGGGPNMGNRGGSRDIWSNDFGRNGGGGGGCGGGLNGGGNDFGDFNNFGNNRNFNNGGNNGGNGNFDMPFNRTSGLVNTGNFGGNNFGAGSGFGNNNNPNNSGGGGGGNNYGGGSVFGNNNLNSGGGGGFGAIGGGRNDNNRDFFCVHMRGLPYNSFKQDICKFFDPIRPANINIIYNGKGQHSGTADAFFESYDDAQDAMKRHREPIGNRYIELFFDGKSKGNNVNNFSSHRF